MKQVARGLAGYGRYGDNNLVHVSDEELRGIEQLTGRKFTRNPVTGLPEAFNFGDAIKMALPVIAGITATALTGGAAAPLALAAGAGASGLTSAGIAKAEGKSTEEALMKGLISGATSYAGGSLMSGVGSGLGETVGANAGQITPFGAAMDAGTNVGASVGGAADVAGSVAAPSLQGMTTDAAMASLPVEPTFGTSGAEALSLPLPPPATPTPPPMPIGETVSGGVNNLTGRLSGIAQDPMGALGQLGSNIMASPQSAGIAALGTYAQMSDTGGRPRVPGQDTYDPNKYPERFPAVPRVYTPPPAGYVAGRNPEFRYFAKGGLATIRQEGGMTENVMNEAKAALLGEHPKPQDALARFEGMFGRGALELLRDRITGGRVRGSGGGMDDLIPGTIEGRQKVRLADGEFVIPADVVSGIGDGSTDQGVRRLHEMMNKVRKERTGKTAQPKAIGGKISL